jgi:hypothetical protein
MPCFKLSERLWETWCRRLAEILLQQSKEGAPCGSWQLAIGYSRVTTTALRVLSLEAFYRYSRMIR